MISGGHARVTWRCPAKISRRFRMSATTLAHTAIYARLNTKAVDRALQTQEDRLCSLGSGVDVLSVVTQDLTATR